MFKKCIFSLCYMFFLNVLFMWTIGIPEIGAVEPQIVKNAHYYVRIGESSLISTHQERLILHVQKTGSDVEEELLIGGKTFKQHYGVSIVNILDIKLFGNWLIVHGEMWNNGGLIMVFDLETGEPLPIDGGRRNIAIWCYRPVVISNSGEKVAFVIGYPRNARGVHEAVSVLDITTLPEPPIPVSPNADESVGTIWRVDDEETFTGVMGDMIWTPDEQGLIFFEGTTKNGIRKYIELVYVDLCDGLESPTIYKERFDPDLYITDEFKQRGDTPYFFPKLEIGDDERIKVYLNSSDTGQAIRSQSQVQEKRQSIWQTDTIHLPLPHH